jgi:hypothetical protein
MDGDVQIEKLVNIRKEEGLIGTLTQTQTAAKDSALGAGAGPLVAELQVVEKFAFCNRNHGFVKAFIPALITATKHDSLTPRVESEEDAKRASRGGIERVQGKEGRKGR